METSQTDADLSYRILLSLFVPISADLSRYTDLEILKVMPSTDFSRGDVVNANLEGAKGHEKQGTRPCLVIQNDIGNQNSPLTIVAPLSDENQYKELPVQVKVSAKELGKGGKDSVIECGQIRTMDSSARIEKKLTELQDDTMEQVDTALQVSLGLKSV